MWSESNLVATAILNLTSLLRMFRSGATQCSAVHCIEGDKRWSLKLDTEPTTSTKTAVNSTQRWRSTSQFWVQPPVVMWARQWKSWWKALFHQIFRGLQWFQGFFNAVNSFEPILSIFQHCCQVIIHVMKVTPAHSLKLNVYYIEAHWNGGVWCTQAVHAKRVHLIKCYKELALPLWRGPCC